MVFDAAFIAGTVASFMMNGACCMYQMNREEELREDLREELKKEWYKQRKASIKHLHKEHQQQYEDFENRYQQLLERQEDQSYTMKHYPTIVTTTTGTISTKGSTPSASSSTWYADGPSHLGKEDGIKCIIVAAGDHAQQQHLRHSQQRPRQPLQKQLTNPQQACVDTASVDAHILEISRTSSLLDEEDDENDDEEKNQEPTKGVDFELLLVTEESPLEDVSLS